MRRLLLISAFFILITCCKKSNKTQVLSGEGTLTGSDTTCGGWLIRAFDNTLFEPQNLDSFPVVKKDGQPVIFTYYKTQDALMICQVGQAIELISIQDQ
jgi:hypothetical protein